MISPAAYHLIPADWMKSKTFFEPWVWSASPVRAWYSERSRAIAASRVSRRSATSPRFVRS